MKEYKILLKMNIENEKYMDIMKCISEKSPEMYVKLISCMEKNGVRDDVLELISIYDLENIKIVNLLFTLLDNNADIRWYDVVFTCIEKEDALAMIEEIIISFNSKIPISYVEEQLQQCETAMDMNICRKQYVRDKQDTAQYDELETNKQEIDALECASGEMEKQAKKIDVKETDQEENFVEKDKKEKIKEPVENVPVERNHRISYSNAFNEYFGAVLDDETEKSEHFADKLLLCASKAAEEQRKSEEGIKKCKDIIRIQSNVIKQNEVVLAEAHTKIDMQSNEISILQKKVDESNQQLSLYVTKFKEISMMQNSFGFAGINDEISKVKLIGENGDE